MCDRGARHALSRARAASDAGETQEAWPALFHAAARLAVATAPEVAKGDEPGPHTTLPAEGAAAASPSTPSSASPASPPTPAKKGFAPLDETPPARSPGSEASSVTGLLRQRGGSLRRLLAGMLSAAVAGHAWRRHPVVEAAAGQALLALWFLEGDPSPVIEALQQWGAREPVVARAAAFAVVEMARGRHDGAVPPKLRPSGLQALLLQALSVHSASADIQALATPFAAMPRGLQALHFKVVCVAAFRRVCTHALPFRDADAPGLGFRADDPGRLMSRPILAIRASARGGRAPV